MGKKNVDSNGDFFRRPKSDSKVGSDADWKGVDATLLQSVIALASFKGGALRFGYTRDGGAYAIGVYAGGAYFTDYVRPDEDIEDYLRKLLASFDEFDKEAQGSVPVAKGNRR